MRNRLHLKWHEKAFVVLFYGSLAAFAYSVLVVTVIERQVGL